MSTYDDLTELLSDLLSRYNQGEDYLKQYPNAPTADSLKQRLHQIEREIQWVGFWHHFLGLQDELKLHILHLQITPVEDAKDHKDHLKKPVCMTLYHDLKEQAFLPDGFVRVMVQEWQKKEYGEAKFK